MTVTEWFRDQQVADRTSHEHFAKDHFLSFLFARKERKESAYREAMVKQFLDDHGFAGINVPKKFRFSFWTSRESICPVHLVAMRGDYGQMLLLLASDADPSATTSKGRTALSIARQYDKEGSHRAVVVLLECVDNPEVPKQPEQVPFCFLDTQYRAHPMLMEFSAACIYDGNLKNGVDASKRPRPNGLPWPGLESPAMFLESNVEEHLEGESKANHAEALKVKDLVRGLLQRGEVNVEDIGVVTPYKGQVRVLRKIMHQQNSLDIPEEEAKMLEIASVDNFQGREKEVIIFSAVRCNTAGQVGFLKDWRRLNVMVTRARRALVVIGNAMTLCKDEHWKKWLETTEKQGGARKGTVKKALQDGETFEGIVPCEDKMDFIPTTNFVDVPMEPVEPTVQVTKRNWSDLNSDDEEPVPEKKLKTETPWAETKDASDSWSNSTPQTKYVEQLHEALFRQAACEDPRALATTVCSSIQVDDFPCS
eukprot:symbB.v1.2.018249.t1/scaffold1447.1/size118252/9